MTSTIRRTPDEISALLDSLSLAHGSHPSRDSGMCVMEAVAYVAGEPHSDHPQCTSRVITAMMIRYNDRLPSNAERDRWVKPLVPLLIGTRTTAKDDTTRAYMAADWLIRWRLPSALRHAGLEAEAVTLEALPPVVDAASARHARSASKVARDKIWAIRSERWQALRSKYYAAAGAAAADAAAAAAAADADAADAAAADADAADAAAADADAAAAAAAADAAAAAAAADADAADAAAADADAAAAAAAADAAGAAAADAAAGHPMITLAIETANKTVGDYWDKRNAAYVAVRTYVANGGENPFRNAYRANTDKHREAFGELIARLCAVGRAA